MALVSHDLPRERRALLREAAAAKAALVADAPPQAEQLAVNVGRWPGVVRVAIVAGLAFGLWAAILVGAIKLFAR